jgi:hypothetical protein
MNTPTGWILYQPSRRVAQITAAQFMAPEFYDVPFNDSRVGSFETWTPHAVVGEEAPGGPHNRWHTEALR